MWSTPLSDEESSCRQCFWGWSKGEGQTLMIDQAVKDEYPKLRWKVETFISTCLSDVYSISLLLKPQAIRRKPSCAIGLSIHDEVVEVQDRHPGQQNLCHFTPNSTLTWPRNRTMKTCNLHHALCRAWATDRRPCIIYKACSQHCVCFR